MSALRQELWLIRHGETEWSAVKRHTGRTDIPLIPAGERQAAALSRSLAGRQFASVLCSPLCGVRETCRLAGYGDVASMTDDLLEWDHGVYEGRTTQEIRIEQPGWSIWTAAVARGESIEQVGAPRPTGNPAGAGGGRRRHAVCSCPYPPRPHRVLAAPAGRCGAIVRASYRLNKRVGIRA